MSKKKNQPQETVKFMGKRYTFRADADTEQILQTLIQKCKMKKSDAIRELIREGRKGLAEQLSSGASDLAGQ